MQQLKILIADDEPIARDIIIAYVAKMPMLEVAATCQNAIEVFETLNKQTIDILFLDINMPEISGIDLLKSLRNPPLVIFTTAYSEYAVESYELNAVDYLLKPISFERFAKAVNKAISLREEKPPGTPTQDNSLFVKSDGKLVRIDINELLLIEGVKDYVKLWAGDKPLMVHSTMKNMEEQLAQYQHMVRVHKSYIVNLSKVREVEGNALRLGQHEVVIGSTYREKVFELLDKWRLL